MPAYEANSKYTEHHLLFLSDLKQMTTPPCPKWPQRQTFPCVPCNPVTGIPVSRQKYTPRYTKLCLCVATKYSLGYLI